MQYYFIRKAISLNQQSIKPTFLID